jgi:hypothetical protein
MNKKYKTKEAYYSTCSRLNRRVMNKLSNCWRNGMGRLILRWRLKIKLGCWLLELVYVVYVRFYIIMDVYSLFIAKLFVYIIKLIWELIMSSIILNGLPLMHSIWSTADTSHRQTSSNRPGPSTDWQQQPKPNAWQYPLNPNSPHTL